MKRNLLLALFCLLFALFLTGCGSTAAAPSPAPAETPAPVESTVPVGTGEPEASAVPEASSEPEASIAPAAELPDAGLVQDTEADSSDADAVYELARSFIDKPFAELQAEIGEPDSVSYVSSCLIPGGQDGELHYDGFTVYTVKSGDSETVQDVIAD